MAKTKSKLDLSLGESEVKLLQRLARLSKMDCWFDMQEDGKVFDLENESKQTSTKHACRQLLDGLSMEDLEHLNNNEMYTLLNIALMV